MIASAFLLTHLEIFLQLVSSYEFRVSWHDLPMLHAGRPSLDGQWKSGAPVGSTNINQLAVTQTIVVRNRDNVPSATR
ncbi:MAG: hypothetical protein KDB23_33345, partial [Planctomycetales bacterium]|nr:hypothetical protein [Planctomycetales bacterium]